ncbi:hypothetical protein FLJC2902T_13990 [Flavobacterium limnosediminis JC2902]|uniref:Uncharacterized protein n=1 Tax=Flavobacterium limnosediminis JC2902 TaxID=1341181 RepID=V6SRJ2_9FLAO|nr:hypothetical protein FLJC2902T_13990 [Flavobacterium limnosediminis JC2902]
MNKNEKNLTIKNYYHAKRISHIKMGAHFKVFPENGKTI